MRELETQEALKFVARGCSKLLGKGCFKVPSERTECVR